MNITNQRSIFLTLIILIAITGLYLGYSQARIISIDVYGTEDCSKKIIEQNNNREVIEVDGELYTVIKLEEGDSIGFECLSKSKVIRIEKVSLKEYLRRYIAGLY